MIAVFRGSTDEDEGARVTQERNHAEPDPLAPHGAPERTSALVTGAGSGIGRAVAHALHTRGVRLILNGRHAAALEDTLPACEAVAHAVADTGDQKALAPTLASCAAEQGPVSVAVLSAGINTPGHFLDVSAEAV